LRLKDTLCKLKTFILLIANLRYRYRLEIEDYHPSTCSAQAFHLEFFHSFLEAQQFIKDYQQPFYLMRLFEQDDNSKAGFSLCNIVTGQIAGVEIEETFDYELDEFGYELPVKLSAGWYKRGEVVHHPIYVKVTRDLQRISREVAYRYENRNNPFYTLKNVVRDVFQERHPNAPAHFHKNFYNALVWKMHQIISEDARNKGC